MKRLEIAPKNYNDPEYRLVHQHNWYAEKLRICTYIFLPAACIAALLYAAKYMFAVNGLEKAIGLTMLISTAFGAATLGCLLGLLFSWLSITLYRRRQK